MRFSWLIVPVLAATVAVRLGLASEPTSEDHPRMLADISALLAEQGFATRIDVRDGPDAVLASRQACTVAVLADLPNYGGIELFARRYGAGRTVRMFYQEAFVSDLPRWRMTWNYYRQGHLARFGFDSRYPPLVLIATAPGCDLRAIDWSQLRFHRLPPASA